MIRLRLLVASAAALAAVATAAPPGAAADTLGDCDGVVVVVDGIDGGGEVSARCVVGATDGLDALGRAGHDYTFLAGSPGFVCTIDRIPDPCNGAPVDAYWSYWTADDGDWSYARVGAGSRRTTPGAVDGWRFGDGRDPPRADDATLEDVSTDVADEEAATAAPDDAEHLDASQPRGLAVAVTAAIAGALGVLAWRRRR